MRSQTILIDSADRSLATLQAYGQLAGAIIVYEIFDDEKVVMIHRIQHRSDVYQSR